MYLVFYITILQHFILFIFFNYTVAIIQFLLCKTLSFVKVPRFIVKQ